MKSLFAAAIAATLLTGAVTTAQADDDRHGRHERHRDWDRGHDRDRRHDWRHDGQWREPRWRDDHRRNDHWRHDDWRRRNDWRREQWRDHRRDDRWERRAAYETGYRHGRYDRGYYQPPRGYYRHAWRHGEYLPREYCDGRYVVSDYHRYRLSPPPYGHHWVRVNEDVVLAAVASGLVVSVVNGMFY